LDKAVNTRSTRCANNMMAVLVAQVAAERGVGIVLPSHAIALLSDKSLDITDTVAAAPQCPAAADRRPDPQVTGQA